MFRNGASESGCSSAATLRFDLFVDQLTHGNSIPVEQGNWAGQGGGPGGGVFLESPPVADALSCFRPKGSRRGGQGLEAPGGSSPHSLGSSCSMLAPSSACLPPGRRQANWTGLGGAAGWRWEPPRGLLPASLPQHPPNRRSALVPTAFWEAQTVARPMTCPPAPPTASNLAAAPARTWEEHLWGEGLPGPPPTSHRGQPDPPPLGSPQAGTKVAALPDGFCATPGPCRPRGELHPLRTFNPSRAGPPHPTVRSCHFSREAVGRQPSAQALGLPSLLRSCPSVAHSCGVGGTPGADSQALGVCPAGARHPLSAFATYL